MLEGRGWDEIEKVVAKADAPEYTSALISESEEMIDESNSKTKPFSREPSTGPAT